LVSPGGAILDAGCGAGRDARAFRERGYRVVAMDASAEMARLAAEYAGVEALVGRFQDLDFDAEFDGVWACASLLHVRRSETGAVLARLARALKSDGALYASFKLGESEGERGGRRFTDWTEAALAGEVSHQPELEIARMWRTKDLRPEHEDEVWVNL